MEPYTMNFTVEEQHMNAHGTCHGGFLYYFCNEAVAGACTAAGRAAVGANGSIHYYRPANLGDTLTATATLRKSGKRMGTYFVELTNSSGKLICDALFDVAYVD